jgi:hypothetical protein
MFDAIRTRIRNLPNNPYFAGPLGIALGTIGLALLQVANAGLDKRNDDLTDQITGRELKLTRVRERIEEARADLQNLFAERERIKVQVHGLRTTPIEVPAPEPAAAPLPAPYPDRIDVDPLSRGEADQATIGRQMEAGQLGWLDAAL